MLKDNKQAVNNSYYMYNRNKNFSSGYFPDFITLHDPIYYQIANNEYNSFYHIKIKDEKYVKHLSNRSSRYNNAYFDNLKTAYRISKKYSGKISNLSKTQQSIGISVNQFKPQNQLNLSRGTQKASQNNNSTTPSPLGNLQYGNNKHTKKKPYQQPLWFQTRNHEG